MDFNELIKPYTENGRTVGGQVKWLIKNGLPITSVQFAMSKVYKEVESGLVFPSGHDLDQEILKVAREHHSLALEDQMKRHIDEISVTLDSDWNKLTKWQKIKQVMQGLA